MKLVRLTLVCSLLLLAAVPSFAECATCIDRTCVATPGSGTRCRYISGIPVTCQTVVAPGCMPAPSAAESAMLAEWTVASIEIICPAEDTKAVTPAAVAQVVDSPVTLQK